MWWTSRVLVRCLAVALSPVFSSSLLYSGSTTTSSTTPSSPTYPACPARPPELVAGTGESQVLVPTGATALVDCGYEYPQLPAGPTKRFDPGPRAGPRVSGRAVAGYALLLDTQPPAQPAQQACLRQAVTADNKPYDVLVFGYPGGRTVEVVWDAVCYLGGGQFPGVAIGSDGPSASLSFSAGTLLGGLLAYLYAPSAPPPPPGMPNRPAPDLVGLPIDAALATARSYGFTIEVNGELLDGARPLGTVDVQTPPPGAPASAGWPLTLVVSVPEASPCRADQLRGLATAGVPGAGTAFASLLLRDVSAEPCTLLGPLEVTAVDHLGQPLTVTDTVPTPQPLVLSPLSPVPSRPSQPSTLAADLLLASTDYAGNCSGRTAHPSAWLVTLPDHSQLTAPVANQAENNAPVIVCSHRVTVGPVSFAGWQPSPH